MKDDISNVAIGQRLERFRLALEIETQAALAAVIGVSTNRYNNWATGVSRLPVEFAVKLSSISGVPIAYFFTGDMSGVPMRLITLLEQPVSPSKKRRGRSSK